LFNYFKQRHAGAHCVVVLMSVGVLAGNQMFFWWPLAVNIPMTRKTPEVSIYAK
jgi:hypothetical protein